MNCLKFLVKYVLFLVNLVITIAALVIIGIGGYGLHRLYNTDGLDKIMEEVQSSFSQFNLEDILQYVLIAVIVLGSVIFLISFCGCCGSITENKCLLGSYATVMLLLAGLSIAVLVVGNKNAKGLDDLVKENLHDKFYTPETPIADPIINSMQYVVKCCGYEGTDFYNDTTIAGITEQEILDIIHDKLTIPGIGLVSPSCCSTINLQAFQNDWQNYIRNDFNCTANDVYQEGCMPKVMSYVEMIKKYFLIVFASVVGTTLLAFIFGIGFCCSIKRKDKIDDRYNDKNAYDRNYSYRR